MWISGLTFTGADDSTDPLELGEISAKNPFVEWGILFPSKGGSRFPSKVWVNELYKVQKYYPMKLSAHLCEPYVLPLVSNGETLQFIEDAVGADAWAMFKRTQINLHGHPYMFHPYFIEEIKNNPNKEFILQLDQTNDHFTTTVEAANVSLLVDTSHGSGYFANEWPQYPGKKYGYAGGLGIETLPTAIEKWQKDNLFIDWIDMETKVRDKGDFSIPRVKEVISYMREFMWTGGKDARTRN